VDCQSPGDRQGRHSSRLDGNETNKKGGSGMIRGAFIAIVVTMMFGRVACAAEPPKFSGPTLRIGVLNDASGPNAALAGPGSVVGARMAIEEFGGKVLGVPIELLSADHQNKADVGGGIARKWYDADNVSAIFDVSNSAVSLAIAALVKDRAKLVFHNSGTTAITGAACTPHSIQWMYNGYATTANLVTKQDIAAGLDSFFIIAVDYALGKAVTNAFKTAIVPKGVKIVGEVRHPLGTSDFSSYLLQAQASGAKAVLFANGGTDLSGAIKQAADFQLTPKMKLFAAAMTTSEIETDGQAVMQGVREVSFYEWSRSDLSRHWAEAFAARNDGKLPVGSQAATYSQVRAYLKAVEQAGTDDADAILEKLKAMQIDDAFTANGRLRADGQLVHDMYVVEVKSPEQSKSKGDYTSILETIPGDKAFQTAEQSECPTYRK
jgi:branched-chain amino acid transport system substrate-binding protein